MVGDEYKHAKRKKKLSIAKACLNKVKITPTRNTTQNKLTVTVVSFVMNTKIFSEVLFNSPNNTNIINILDLQQQLFRRVPLFTSQCKI